MQNENCRIDVTIAQLLFHLAARKHEKYCIHFTIAIIAITSQHKKIIGFPLLLLNFCFS